MSFESLVKTPGGAGLMPPTGAGTRDWRVVSFDRLCLLVLSLNWLPHMLYYFITKHPRAGLVPALGTFTVIDRNAANL